MRVRVKKCVENRSVEAAMCEKQTAKWYMCIKHKRYKLCHLMTYWLHSFPVFIIRFAYLCRDGNGKCEWVSEWERCQQEDPNSTNAHNSAVRARTESLFAHIHFLLLLNDMPAHFFIFFLFTFCVPVLVSVLFSPFPFTHICFIVTHHAQLWMCICCSICVYQEHIFMVVLRAVLCQSFSCVIGDKWIWRTCNSFCRYCVRTTSFHSLRLSRKAATNERTKRNYERDENWNG